MRRPPLYRPPMIAGAPSPGMRAYVTAQGVTFYAPEGFTSAEGAAHTLEVLRAPTPADELDVAPDGTPAEMPKSVQVAHAAPPASMLGTVPGWAWLAGAGAVAYLVTRTK